MGDYIYCKMLKMTFKRFGFILLVIGAMSLLHACKNKNPSVAKIYVRSSSNQLIEGAKVIIIGDVTSNPATNSYVDTLVTNPSGFVEFNLASHFEDGGKDYTVAYFDVVAKTNGGLYGTGYIRTRVYTTAVETIYIQ